MVPELAIRLRRLANQQPQGVLDLVIQGEGNETRAFCEVRDFTAGLMAVVDKGEDQNLYHIGTDEEVSIRQLAVAIGKELGLFTDPYQYYGRLSDEMLRAMRLVVDTGLHSKGWTREQAIDYMLEHSSMAENDVIAEVERYIVIPGQALGYKIGQLRISAMRARAERELGRKFDVKDFHSEILRDGSVPMDVLEKKIDRWIAARK